MGTGNKFIISKMKLQDSSFYSLEFFFITKTLSLKKTETKTLGISYQQRSLNVDLFCSACLQTVCKLENTQ